MSTATLEAPPQLETSIDRELTRFLAELAALPTVNEPYATAPDYTYQGAHHAFTESAEPLSELASPDDSSYYGHRRQPRHFDDQPPAEPLELDLDTEPKDVIGEHPNVGIKIKEHNVRSHRMSAMKAEQERPKHNRPGRLRRAARSVGYTLGMASITSGFMLMMDGISTRFAN